VTNHFFSVILHRKISHPMKIEYLSPESVVIQIRTEQALLIGSVTSENPVPNALEGDTESWGDWIF
jgi:hypothetical protein